jgi:hypothetical protein
MRVIWHLDDVYKVIDNDDCLYQGNLSDCESYIRLREGGYL